MCTMLPSPSPKHQHHTYHQVSLSDDEYMDDTVTDFGGVTLEFNAIHTSSTLQSEEEGESQGQGYLQHGFLSLDTADGDLLPSIAITPMTPPSAGSLSPDQFNQNRGSFSFHHQNRGDPLTAFNSNRWMTQSPLPPPPDLDAKDYFAYRDSIVQHVTNEVHELVDSNDGALKGTWFLTEIDTWDNELERIIVLTDKTILIVKYDFIGMKIEEVRRIHLSIVERVIQGELKYPDKSLTPRLNGLAGGLAGMMKDVIPKVHGTVQNLGCAVLRRNRCGPNAAMMDEQDQDDHSQTTTPPPDESGTATGAGNGTGNGIAGPTECGAGTNLPKNSIMSSLSLEKFEARTRNRFGVRIVWDNNKPVSLYQKWNPFDKSIPWITLTSHPLLWHKSQHSATADVDVVEVEHNSTITTAFDIESFSQRVIEILSNSGGESPMCTVEYKPIVIETYVGLTSLLYNANSLGFYKVRGKVSF